jgi:uncharacterized protein (TIGR03067 family)
MQANRTPLSVAAAIAIAAISFTQSTAQTPSTAQLPPTAIDNELKLLSGGWRVVEMVEDGRAIPQDQMRQWLPGGGILEIVDNTIIFKSPADGSKSTKSFRVDPVSYPKQIAIFDRDSVTGTGIYKIDQGKIVICITNEADQVPTEFSAHAKSGRTLIVLQRFDLANEGIPGMNARLEPRKPIVIPEVASTPAPTQTASAKIPTQPLPPLPQPSSNPPQQIIAESTAAGRVLTDGEVFKMALGTWRINDAEGSVDIVFKPDGTFQTYRYYQTMQNFHMVFVPTPISTGSWSVSGGRLIARVSSSKNAARVNESFVPSVRSISATDMILVDADGKVTRAIKTR